MLPWWVCQVSDRLAPTTVGPASREHQRDLDVRLKASGDKRDQSSAEDARVILQMTVGVGSLPGAERLMRPAP